MTGRGVALLIVFALGRVSIASAQPVASASPWRVDFRDQTAAPRSADTTRHWSILMQSLYATTGVVQGFDARSTFKALDAGAVESNGLLTPFTKRRPAFVAFKIGLAAAIVYGGHSLSKRHKVTAVALLSLINGAYAALVFHNYSVAHRAAALNAVH